MRTSSVPSLDTRYAHLSVCLSTKNINFYVDWLYWMNMEKENHIAKFYPFEFNQQFPTINVITSTTTQDFIRAGVCSPASSHLVLTGSYDHTVRLWDTRTGISVSTVNHGAPVESLLFFPAGGVFVSSGNYNAHLTILSLCFSIVDCGLSFKFRKLIFLYRFDKDYIPNYYGLLLLVMLVG